MKTQQRKRSKAVKGSAGTVPANRSLIGNARVRDAEGKGYAAGSAGNRQGPGRPGESSRRREYGRLRDRELTGPTLIEVRPGDARVAAELQPEDTLLIYYTGHPAPVGRDRQL